MSEKTELAYIRPESISLKRHPEFNERWLQDRIAEDPSILGLGDLVLKDKERAHSGAGRLDILCQDAESNRRYEIEIQLGKTDESHIIRTIEYWDIERKRYPQYEHTAVIVAEDITSRFLNVVNLFNGFIPLIAIKVSALQVKNNVSLIFTTVLDERTLGLVDEDEEVAESTDRAYWEKRATKATVGLADEILKLIRTFDPLLSLKYNKFYIGLADQNGSSDNFAVLKPKKDWLRLELRLPRDEGIESKIEAAGLDVLEYNSRERRYKLRLTKAELEKHEEFILELLKDAHGDSAE
ncbi:hypothetical protein LMG3431_00992 [Achromobacter pestifer]|uniref:DUF5655 domain-containing protein n=1 Tax=Achromobacter pestifer TaxID=1353889 RepID=A0A6S6YL99_9BURK|nr:hypothetical protein LMG3431_00992 [Achromobacter pestifer]